MPNDDFSSERKPEEPPPTKCDDCDPDCQSDEPIAYGNGQIVLRSTDIAWSGLGFSWSHARSYANILRGGARNLRKWAIIGFSVTSPT